MLALQHAIPLNDKNTLGLPAIAERYFELNDEQQLADLQSYCQQYGAPSLILGGGSNLVLAEHIAGLVVQVNLRGRRLLREDQDFYYVEVAAGENWHASLLWTLQQGWPGLENLALIPGTVGAAPIQNIGAYGLELQERFASLRAYDLRRGVVVTLDKAACQFAYRDSVFKQAEGKDFVVLSVCFALPKAWQPVLHYAELARQFADSAATSVTALQIAEAVMRIRRAKLPDPAEIGNAGSFFKNPIVSQAELQHLLLSYPDLVHYPAGTNRFKLAAGWLIERAGWKGRQLGAAAVYHKQALVLINAGGARAADIRQLAAAIQAEVFAKFAVKLEIEPIVL